MPPRHPPSSRRPLPPTPEVILQLLHESFEGPAWHGPSVRDALRGVDHRLAQWRPGVGRHSIWELTLHLAALRHRVRRRIRPVGVGRFPRRMTASWWPALPPVLDESAWTQDVAILEAEQSAFVDLIAELTPAELAATLPSRRTAADQLLGAALHDSYHAGQIVMLRRLAASRTSHGKRRFE